jgi:3-oxoacyl-[acyl-carrier protein] reductase
MTEAMPDTAKDMMLGRVSLKRFGKVEDVANLVGFLASKDADYITGQVISIDGGLSI